MVRSLPSTLAAVAMALATSPAVGFQSPSFADRGPTHTQRRSDTTSLPMAADVEKKGYVPKWKKKLTLAEKMELENGGKLNAADTGLIGTVPVVFHQGNVTKTTMAIAGQPLSQVATQANQFIKYGCGKGECGTCEALCNGKWIRPCTTVVPADLALGEEYVIQVKEVKAKSKSSGKFYSVRSFFMGFYNNLLGMVGFVKTRRRARENYNERMEYEQLVAQRVKERKEARAAADAQVAKK